MTTTIHIKNMVCSRCIRVVREELEAAGLRVLQVSLGEAIVAPETIDMAQIHKRLQANGFEVLESANARIVETVKTLIIELVHSDELGALQRNLSAIVAGRIGKDYTYLSHLFSSVEARTIERFFILQKIERAKELLIYNERSISEIAYYLGYSSPSHLSRQFRHETGFTPSAFKTARNYALRTSLESVGA